MDIYAHFPERLKATIASKQTETFKMLWSQLTSAEKIKVNESRTPVIQNRSLLPHIFKSNSPLGTPRKIQIVMTDSTDLASVTSCDGSLQIVIPTEVHRIENKLQELIASYEVRKAIRMKETESLSQAEKDVSLETFDKAYNSLVFITKTQLLHAQSEAV